MEAFLHPLQGLAEFEGIKKRCGANCGILNVSGLSLIHISEPTRPY